MKTKNVNGIEDLVRLITEDVDTSLSVKRTFITHELENVIRNRLNEILDHDEESRDTVMALLLYPVIDWILKGRDIDYIMQKIAEDSMKMKDIRFIQDVIEDLSGYAPTFILSNRKAYFDACVSFKELIDSIINSLSKYPDKQYYLILCAITNKCDGNCKPAGRFLINKHIYDLIEIIRSNWGDKISASLDSLVTGKIPSAKELEYVHHNINLLSKEYRKILWKSSISEDKAVNILSCRSMEEVINITENDEKYRQAYVIGEFVRMINGAIELLGEFPKYGDMYKETVSVEFSDLYSTDIDSVLDKLKISRTAFYNRKRFANLAFTSILWGCDCDDLVKLLSM